MAVWGTFQMKVKADETDDYMETFYEGASQTFTKGHLVKLASGLVVKVDGTIGTLGVLISNTEILGFAMQDASGTTGKDILVAPIKAGNLYLLGLSDSSGDPVVRGASNVYDRIGATYGLVYSPATVAGRVEPRYQVNTSQTTAGSVLVQVVAVEIEPGKPGTAAETSTYAWCRFLPFDFADANVPILQRP